MIADWENRVCKTLEMAVFCLGWRWSRGSAHVIKVCRTKYTDVIQGKWTVLMRSVD